MFGGIPLLSKCFVLLVFFLFFVVVCFWQYWDPNLGIAMPAELSSPPRLALLLSVLRQTLTMLHRLALNSLCGADPELAILLFLSLQSDWDDRPAPAGSTCSYVP